MAQKVSNFTDADELDGTEFVPVIQDGDNRKTTVQDIADKANAAAIIDDAVPAFDKTYSSEKTQALIDAEATARANADTDLQTAIDLKLNAADYNDRFKGKYTTLSALQTAYPTASAGDYAQIDAGSGSDVINYNYDLEDGWIEGGSGSSATNTDALPEGSVNLYFTAARAQAAISGTANRISITAGVIDISATYVGQNTITTLGTIATGTWQGTAIASGYGGTGFSAYAKGDIIYASAANTLAKLAAGTDGYVLTLDAGLPVWKPASGGGGGGIYAGTGTAFTSYAKGDLIFASDVNVLSKLSADTNGKVLTLVSGVPAWSASGVSWSRSGNAGTVAGTDFIGTTDDVDFVIKRNNVLQLVVKPLSIFMGENAGFGVIPIRSNFFGSNAGNGATNASNSNFFGSGAGNGATSAATANFFGPNAGLNASGASNSNFFGNNAGSGATSAGASNFFGNAAGSNASGAGNSNFFGNAAGSGASSATRSNFFGQSAGLNATSANNSNFFGQQAGWASASARNSNFFGTSAGQQASDASYSTLIGYNVGSNATFALSGSNIVILGCNITTPTASSSNMFNIGNVLYGFNTYGTTTGNPATAAQTTGKISIGTNAPAASAILDLTSTTMGFLPPRMSTTNASSIATKAEALFLYDTDLKKYKFWNGTAFEVFTSA